MAGVVAAASVVVVDSGPAEAADAYRCPSQAPVFAQESGGAQFRYPFNAPGTANVTVGSRVAAGTGFTYPKMFGGAGGNVYAINSEGLWRYHFNGSGWDTQPDGSLRQRLSTGFTQYVTAAFRNKITSDELGDIYLVDANGVLRWYRYDYSKNRFAFSRAIDVGWGRYNLIVASGPGVLYGRDAASGQLFRSRFEPTSQRWLSQHVLVGAAAWANFTKGVFSAGGGTLFGIQGDGDLFHYRYREDDNTWPVLAKETGTAVDWSQFANVYGLADSCVLTDSKVPARPSTPVVRYSPTVGVQKAADGGSPGALEWVFPDNSGDLRHGYQGSADDFGTIQWAGADIQPAVTGRISLLLNSEGNVRMVPVSTTADVWSYTREAPPSTSWVAGTDLAGFMTTGAVGVRLSDGTPVIFALDADGVLWHRRHDATAGDLLGWMKLGGSGLNELRVSVTPDGVASVFALNASGTPVNAVYTNGTLSAWTDLGGTGFTSGPAVVALAGQLRRVFARASDGRILTQAQSTGGAWPRTWTPVGTFTGVGTPAAVRDPQTNQLTVVSRGTDDEVYRVVETETGSGAWGDWKLLNDSGDPDPSATDPTITEYVNSGGKTYVVAYRNAANAPRFYVRRSPQSKKSSAAPRFTAHRLPPLRD